MTRRPLTVAAIGLLAAVGAWNLRPSPSRAKAQGRPGALTAAPKAAPLMAEGYVVDLQTVRETVPSLGTLRANESVTIVAESSRRVVGVHFGLVDEAVVVAVGLLEMFLDVLVLHLLHFGERDLDAVHRRRPAAYGHGSYRPQTLGLFQPDIRCAR